MSEFVDSITAASKSVGLNGAQVNAVITALDDESYSDYYYRLLNALGRNPRPEYESVFAKKLTYYDDGQVVQAALRGLIFSLGKYQVYKEALLELAKGQSWDEFGEAQLEAVALLGYCLRDSSVAKVAKEILLNQIYNSHGVVSDIAYEVVRQYIMDDSNWLKGGHSASSIKDHQIIRQFEEVKFSE